MRSTAVFATFVLSLAPSIRVLAAPPPPITALEIRQSTGVDSSGNNNAVDPAIAIHPQKASGDAPYSLDEKTLRSAIYIPSTFEYGKGGKQPVLLVPGTAVPGGTTYANAFGKLLAATSYADPVWVNIPGYSLGDIQVNAEYVAYAINYLSGVSGQKNISVISWSQGGVDVQWGFKYWPSTRSVVSDFIPLSPDFKGTTEAFVLCTGLTPLVCTPSILQQKDTSKFVAALRADGGDSAYVPTTTFYSSTDQIVQPQSGTGASAYLLDARNVGVTNNQIQTVCPGTIQLILHEAVLYNAVAWALIEDALTHDGPGQTSRLNKLSKLCVTLAAPGLNPLLGESVMINAVANIAVYTPKASQEPALVAYAS